MNRYERDALLTAISVIGAHAQDVADDELSYPNPDYRARVAAEVDEISRWLAGLLTSKTASWKQTKKGSNQP